MFSGVYALGFSDTWVGRLIQAEDLQKLVELNQRYGVSIIGRGVSTRAWFWTVHYSSIRGSVWAGEKSVQAHTPTNLL